MGFNLLINLKNRGEKFVPLIHLAPPLLYRANVISVVTPLLIDVLDEDG